MWQYYLIIYILIRHVFKDNDISDVYKIIVWWQFQVTNTIVLDINMRH